MSGSDDEDVAATTSGAQALEVQEQEDEIVDDEEEDDMLVVPDMDFCDLEKSFKQLQGPFVWSLPDYNEAKMSRHICRLRDLLFVPHSTWGTVVLRFTLCWLYFKHGDYDKSRAELSEIDALLQTLDWTDEEGALLRRCSDAVEHVLQATWAHLAQKSVSLEDMHYELAQIVPYQNLDNQQKAAVWGLQASCRYCFFEWVGFRLKSAALRAQELYPREPEWQRVYGDQPASVIGDAFTPHIAIYSATWHLQKKRTEPAKELLRRALLAWPDNAFVQLNAACMYGREKSLIRDDELAEVCSAAAVRLAPDCVIVNVVRRLVHPSHNAPCLALCEITYGKGVLALLPFLGAGTFSLEVIMRGFFMR